MKHRIRTAIAGILALILTTAAVAQTFPTVPSRSVIGRLGTPGTSGPSQAIPFATLGAQLGVINTGWLVVGSATYPTIQSAFTAAMSMSSSRIWLPCGTYNIGTAASAATGIDIRNSTNIHVEGPDGPNGGVGQCAMINYLGTGTAVTYGGSTGLEWGHTYVRTLTGAKLFDGTTGSGTNTTYSYFHDNMIVGLTGTTVLFDIASDVAGKFTRNAMAGGLIGIRGITGAGGIPSGQFAVNTTIGPTNAFQPTITGSAIQGMETGSVFGNIFQGQILAYSSGPANTCLMLNWMSNWHGDSTVPQALIQSNCWYFASQSNTYSQAGGVAITQANSSGKVSSVNDFFSTGTWVAIGTGNLLSVESSSPATFAPVITGSATGTGAASAKFGRVGIQTALPLADLQVGVGADASGLSPNFYINTAGAAAFAVRDSTNDIEFGMFTNTSGGGLVAMGSRTSHPFWIQTNGANMAAFHVSTGFSVGSTTDPGTGNITASGVVRGTAGFRVTNLLASNSAPVATTFCTTPSIPAHNGTAAFTINVGSACATSVGTITMPAATTGWVCDFQNVTNPATSVIGQTGGTTTTVTVTNYVRTTGVAGNWTSSDVIRAKCSGY